MIVGEVRRPTGLSLSTGFRAATHSREDTVRRLFASALLLCALAVPAHAQVAQPRGATVRHAAVVSYSSDTAPRQSMTVVPSKGRGSVWPWLGVGALGGAVAGGVWGAWVFAHTDDAFFPQYAIGGGAVIGAVTGAVFGGLLYAVTR